MTYVPTNWQNNVAPPLSAANLNKLTDAIEAQAAEQSIRHSLPTWVDGSVPALTDPTPLNEMERVLAAVASALGLSYTPTAWQSGWTPTRNAARFNRMEQQVVANEAAVPPSSYPVANPITISSGGLYTGYDWTSVNAGTPCITITTPQAVTIRNAAITSSVASLIATPTTLNLTLENVRITGRLTPAPRLLDVDRWTNFTMRNCTIDKSAGCSFGFPGSPGATMLITRNRHLNVNKMNATVSDTHGQFIQIRDTQGASIEISWNEILNEPELVWSEDLISIISTSDAYIHDNYIQHISAPNYQVCTQGAITVEGSSNNVRVLNNQMVDVPAGLGFYGGTSNCLGQGNRLIQDGYYPDGTHRIVEGWAGFFVASGTNNRIDGNVSGYVNRDGQRLDWDPNSAYNLASTNTTLPGTITRQMELDEWPRWQQKLSANGVTVGAS